MNQYRIMVQEDAEDVGRGLRSFAEWLRDDDAIQGSALINLVRNSPRAGEMGGGFDAIQLAADSSFQLANLALAYVAWRGSRTRPSAVTIEHRGTRITLTDADPETVGRIVTALDRG